MSDSGSVSPKTQSTAAPAGSSAGAAVCTACALVCTDLLPRTGQCDRGDEALRLRRAESSVPRLARIDGAWIDGAAADADAAIAEAASRLRAARRVLVTGLGGVTVEECRLACDVAEALGAAVAAAAPAIDAADPAALARSGAVTAAWEELRDRADLVLFWFHDPSPSLPRFVARFVAPPLPSGRPRSTVSVGAGPVAVAGSSAHRAFDLPADAGVALARVLHARLVGRPVGTLPAGVAAAAEAILAAIEQAECVGIVTGEDPSGAAQPAVTALLRALSARLPAFEIPAVDGPPNAAGAEAVLAWRYGAAGDVARAASATLEPVPDAPAPFDAASAFRGGAFDAVLALGPVVGAAAAHEAADRPVEIVAIDPCVAPFLSRGVQLRTRELADSAGGIVRADGTSLALPGCDAAGSPPTVGDLLRRLSVELAAAPGGSR